MDLAPALRDHLFDRLRERKITAEDLYQLKLWRESEPDAPDGTWWRDFGSFKICGEGRYPKARGGYGTVRLHARRPTELTAIVRVSGARACGISWGDTAVAVEAA